MSRVIGGSSSPQAYSRMLDEMKQKNKVKQETATPASSQNTDTEPKSVLGVSSERFVENSNSLGSNIDSYA